MLNLEIRIEVQQELLGNIKIEKHQMYKWRRLNSFPLHFISKKYRNLLKNVKYIKSGTGSAHSKIRIPEKFSKDLAYLMGAMRDGSLIKSRGKHFVRLYDTADAKWISSVKEIFSKLFETEMHLRYNKKFDVAYLEISSKPLFSLMKILFENNMHKDVPEIIKTAPLEIQKSYIEGFFDAEGHVPHKNTKRYQIDFTQKDPKSLEFVKKFLENFGIKCGKISTHRLPIYGKENLSKFHENFTFLNLEKSKRLKFLFEAPPSG